MSSPRHPCTAAPTTCCTTRCPSWGSPSPSSRTPTTRRRGRRWCRTTPRRSSASRSATRRATSSTSRPSPGWRTATAFLIRPFEFGADVVVHSATKYLGGHGTVIAGLIVDGGTFDWRSGRFPGFTTPDPTYNGVVYADLGAPAYALKARVQLLRDLGPAISPFNAFLVVQGIETLSLRMERHVENTLKVAEFLQAHDAVDSVNYPGLESSPWHAAQQKYAPKGAGAVLTFELHGGREAGKRFVDALELHSHVANIGDVRSLVIHPASTTHSQLTPEEQLLSDVDPGLVRLSVGLETIDDILADLDKGFAAAKA